MDIGNKNFFDTQILQSQHAAGNINNRINGPNFVEMHFVNSFTVYPGFSFCQSGKHSQRLRLDLSAQIRMFDNMGYIMQITMFMVMMQRSFRCFMVMGKLFTTYIMLMMMPYSDVFVMMLFCMSMCMLLPNYDVMLMLIWQHNVKIIGSNTALINTFVDQLIFSQMQLFHFRCQVVDRYAGIQQSSQ